MDMETATDPFTLFEAWFAEAELTEPSWPNAMSLATASPDGAPSVRTVLLKGHDRNGFVFYTNFDSWKGRSLQANPRAGLCFYWKSLNRQVHVEGDVTRVSDAEADAYFASRPRDSRLGAWASLQSQPLDRRSTLEARVAEYDLLYSGDDIPRPPHWSGFRVSPVRIEFWHDRPFRLHDRIEFRRDGGGWLRSRLYP
jgi:pyridoxamine 5'-phosphate oxidase